MGHCSPRNMLCPTCYHAKFCHSRSDCMGIGRVPKSLGTLELCPCDWGVVVPLEICPSQTCYCAKSGSFRSNDMSIITEIPRKIRPLTSSCRVTRGHRSQYGSIGYLQWCNQDFFQDQDQEQDLNSKTNTFLWCILEADRKAFFIFGRKRKYRRKWNSS